MSRLALALAALSLSACRRGDVPDRATCPTLPVGSGQVHFRADGTLDLYDAGGDVVVRGAFAAIQLEATEDGPWVRTRDRSGTWAFSDAAGALGSMERAVFTAPGDATTPALRWTIDASPEGFLTARVELDNDTSNPLDVAKTAALRVDGPGDGLFLGTHPETHRVLENGAFTVMDFVAELRTGTDLDVGYGAVAPGAFEGQSVSNWNHAIADLQGDRSWIAGGLSFAHSMPVMALSYTGAQGPTDGRTPFDYLSLESALLPAPKPVDPGGTFGSELFYVHPFEPDPVRGLEHFADRVAQHNAIVPWHRREPGRRVPNGWNSWSGGGSSGGYGTDVDQDLIVANLDFMATELRDWGMDWFQLDDGYEPLYGDWWWRTDRFPDGPAWLSQQIRDRGLEPGLWMAPFTLDPNAQIVSEHPDWLADTSVLGELVVGDTEILDLTHPEVLDWLDQTFRTFRNDWGFRWLKLDFGYYALFGEGLYDEGATREEAWRGALSVIDEALGEDAFFLVVGLTGLHWDLVDSGRTTLDNMPVWDMPGEAVINQQGFLPTVRTAGRRWYLQDRVWINHPDLLFFRTDTEPGWAPLTPDESRALASFVGLSGGIVKIGEPLVDLQGEHVDTIRRLLPIYPTAARQLDVFHREYPEVWHLDVDAPLDGASERWDVVGLFHWGTNLDYGTNPPTPMDETGPKTLSVSLDELQLDGPVVGYEFWTGALVDVDATLSMTVPAHQARVIALRPELDRPQFLGWNRQITMGGTLLQDVAWDDGAQVLSARFQVVPGTTLAPFTWRVGFRAPPGFSVAEVRSSGAAIDGLTWTVDGELIEVSFDAAALGDLTLELDFQGR